MKNNRLIRRIQISMQLQCSEGYCMNKMIYLVRLLQTEKVATSYICTEIQSFIFQNFVHELSFEHFAEIAVSKITSLSTHSLLPV